MNIALYVDDLLVSVTVEQDYDDTFTYMNKVAKIAIKDLGEVKAFCGIQFDSIDDGYRLHETDYIDAILVRHHEHVPKEKFKVPMREYDRGAEDQLLTNEELKVFQELPGSYNWLSTISRPDLAFCVSKFASFTKNAT